jgi:hypothetical protein
MLGVGGLKVILVTECPAADTLGLSNTVASESRNITAMMNVFQLVNL